MFKHVDKLLNKTLYLRGMKKLSKKPVSYIGEIDGILRLCTRCVAF